MPLKSSTKAAYSGLANFCKTGNVETIQNIELRTDRIHHYRRLVFNITNNTLKHAFPLTHKTCKTEQWDMLVNDFFLYKNDFEYRVWMMPKVFYTFVEENNYAEKLAIPFLNDLLLFEWIEIELQTMPDEEIPQFSAIKDLWNEPLILNPEYRLIQFSFPVFTKPSLELFNEIAANYFLFAYREIESRQVKFMNITSLYAFIIEQIDDNYTLTEICNAYQTIFSLVDVDSIKKDIISFIEKLIKKEIILGVKN